MRTSRTCQLLLQFVIFCIAVLIFGKLYVQTPHTWLPATRNEQQKNMKYILDWNPGVYYWCDKKYGQEPFINYNCSHKNCFLISGYADNIVPEIYHAVLFWGGTTAKLAMPAHRSKVQKYIYVNTEPPDNKVHCHYELDGFINWTATFRLDSDIPTPYFTIKNSAGQVVGPKIGMEWKENLSYKPDENFTTLIKNKKKAAAWFVSNCKSFSGREKFVDSLQSALKVYNLSIDIYGYCGTLKCHKFDSKCYEMLETDYFFYLALENTFNEDYVTEKVLNAFDYNVIPIVWGGADYSRFLPPHSYIDGLRTPPAALARQMRDLMRSPRDYGSFFTWKRDYFYHKTDFCNLCSLCASLNHENYYLYSSYSEFRKWWQVINCSN